MIVSSTTFQTTMATDDKKEYKDLLLILNHMGKGSAVLNKLNTLASKMDDPKLKHACEQLAGYINRNPRYLVATQFQLLNIARSYAAEHGDRKTASDRIFAMYKYCEQQISSQVPQWQLIASAQGWVPDWEAAATAAGWLAPSPSPQPGQPVTQP